MCYKIYGTFFPFSMLLLLVFLQPTHQYFYSCNSTAPCGCSWNSASVGRIVGGESAGTSTWNWAVSISIAGSGLCGGSMLSSTWIITAAHCLPGRTPSQIIVYAGSNTRFSGQSRVASNIIMHPNYNGTSKQNDIALIQVSTPFTISSTSISFVCMPSVSSATLSAGEWPPANLYVVAVGWGTLSESGSLPTALQQVTVQTMDYRSSMCSSVLYDRQKQFCAGISGGGKDTCQGDSGGPLMMFTQSNQWVLVGLTSYGIGCARPSYAGVYTRVAYYQDWIRLTTGGVYINATSSTSANIDPYSSSSTSDSTRLATPLMSLVKTLCNGLFIIVLRIIFP